MPAALRLSPPPSSPQAFLRRAARTILGGWCNGNTAVFGTVILGSSPSPPAIGRYRSPSSNITPHWRVACSLTFNRALRALREARFVREWVIRPEKDRVERGRSDQSSRRDAGPDRPVGGDAGGKIAGARSCGADRPATGAPRLHLRSRRLRHAVRAPDGPERDPDPARRAGEPAAVSGRSWPRLHAPSPVRAGVCSRCAAAGGRDAGCRGMDRHPRLPERTGSRSDAPGRPGAADPRGGRRRGVDPRSRRRGGAGRGDQRVRCGQKALVAARGLPLSRSCGAGPDGRDAGDGGRPVPAGRSGPPDARSAVSSSVFADDRLAPVRPACGGGAVAGGDGAAGGESAGACYALYCRSVAGR